MSYQVPAAQPRAKGSRRKGLLLLGIVVLVAGLIGGLAIVGVAQSTYSDAVANLARVPVGCETELDASETASFVVYVETKGEIGDLRGDCDNVGTDYERDDEPDVDVAVFEGDDEIDIERYDDTSYDIDGFVGTAIGRVELEEGTTYTVSVESDDTDFAIAFGHDPKGDADSASAIGLIVAAAGLLIGIVLIILGLRRRPAPPSPGIPAFTPTTPGTPAFGTPDPTAPIPPVPGPGVPTFTPPGSPPPFGTPPAPPAGWTPPPPGP